MLNRAPATLLLLMSLALPAGCAGPNADTTSAPAAAATAAPPSASSTKDGQEITTERRTTIAADLAQLAEAFGIQDPPEVDIIRMVPDWEAPVVQAECMNEQGWAWSADGLQGPELTGLAQREAHDLAWYICKAKFPSNPDHNLAQLSDEQKKLAYEYYAVTLVGCLREHGETIDDVPSERTFIERFDVEGPWSAYQQLDLPRAKLQELEEACPMNIPGKLLWGE